MAFYLQQILLIRHTHPFPQENLMKIIKQQNQVESMLEEIKSKMYSLRQIYFLLLPAYTLPLCNVTPCLYPVCMQCYSLPVWNVTPCLYPASMQCYSLPVWNVTPCLSPACMQCYSLPIPCLYEMTVVS